MSRLGRLRWQRHKDSELQAYTSVGIKKLICYVDNISSYTMLHNSTNVLCRGTLRLSVIKGIRLIDKESKGHACRYFKAMGESINLVFYAWVVIERVVVKISEFRGVPL